MFHFLRKEKAKPQEETIVLKDWRKSQLFNTKLCWEIKQEPNKKKAQYLFLELGIQPDVIFKLCHFLGCSLLR